MNVTNHSESVYKIEKDVDNKIAPPPSNKKVFITIGIIAGIALITAIILMAVLIRKKDKTKVSRYSNNPTEEENNSPTQRIELLIDGREESKIRRIRNLQQNEEKVRILGNNYNEINSSNAVIYINGNKTDFDKFIHLQPNTSTKVEIKFSEKLKTFKEMFKGCDKIKNVILKDVETDLVSDTSSMFEDCTGLTEIKFDNMSIHNITTTSKMFKGCSNFNKIEIEMFKTDKVNDLSQMFEGCSSFDNNTFIEGLSTKNAESLSEMFSGCSKISSLNLSNFDTSNVKNMSGMFKGMTSLEQLDINSFNTAKVEYMNEMFESCSSISSLDLSNFNTEKVINMDKMFSSCSNLEVLNLTSFNLTNCNSTESMFNGTKEELKSLIDKFMEKIGFPKNDKEPIESQKPEEPKEIDPYNNTKLSFDLLFLVDTTAAFEENDYFYEGDDYIKFSERLRNYIIYISNNLTQKKAMSNYSLSIGGVFYGDSKDSYQTFDLSEKIMKFTNFVKNVSFKGDKESSGDLVGAYNVAKSLSWKKDSHKFIIHILGSHYSDYEEIENITYFITNNFSIAGFFTYDSSPDYLRRIQTLFRNNGNYKYFINHFDLEDLDYSILKFAYDYIQYSLSIEFLQGIEVSEKQGDIDWKKVKENNNVDFAIIRAGTGKVDDTKFEKNYNGAKEVGIPLGVYWVAEGWDIADANEENQIFKEIIDGKKFEFPIYYVIEDEIIYSTGNWDVMISSFSGYLNSQNNILGLRANSSQITNTFMNDEFLKFQAWMSDISESFPALDFNTYVWNYNNKGKIDGIEGDVTLVKSLLNYTKIVLDNNYNGF